MTSHDNITPRMERRPGWMAEFKAFVMRGNVIELAVAVILAIAFAAVVTAFIDGIIMPLIAAIVGEPNFDALVATVGDGVIRYGSFLTVLATFLLIAAVLFGIIKMAARLERPKEVDVTDRAPSQEELLAEIRDLLRASSRL